MNGPARVREAERPNKALQLPRRRRSTCAGVPAGGRPGRVTGAPAAHRSILGVHGRRAAERPVR
jgi:hypothetical protein